MPVQPASTPSPPRLRIGEGKISAALSTFLALLSLGGVLCFSFPEQLTTPEFRVHYPIALLRWLLSACMVLALGFGILSIVLGRRLGLGLPGIAIVFVALLAGGSEVDLGEVGIAPSVSLDWLVIDSLLLASIFIPLELFLPQRRSQTKFHPEWRTDLCYFIVSHLVVQYTAALIRAPAQALFGDAGFAGAALLDIRAFIAGLPIALALPLAMLAADLFQYAAHRAFHRVPLLWRFHSVHHCIRTMDWLAGSRLHLVDVLVTRAFSYLPLYALGFSGTVFHAYVAIVALQAVSAHANTRLRFGFVEHLLVTPRYHAWHHTDDPAHYDENFAIHFPWIDRLFGTHHLPRAEWPVSMGLGQTQFPKGYLRQLIHPFLHDPSRTTVADPSRH